MTQAASTCWTVIQGAAAGRGDDRDQFARRYAPVVRAYLGARWRDAGAAMKSTTPSRKSSSSVSNKAASWIAQSTTGRGGSAPFCTA